MASKAARKAIYLHKLHAHLKDNTHLVVVTADNLSVNQTKAIRQELRAHSTVLMGKNAWIRHAIAVHAPTTGKPAFVGAIPFIAGKVGVVLTNSDPEEVSEDVAAKAGTALRPMVCSSMDIGMCSLWQWLVGFHLELVAK
ncbi:large ribosomal subunit protein uL10z-like [Bidens hawaiensis]|uniref:large ribosomal subunit protein uL10z-like n=1 Tax=Bidens hawaiensis TaxID=980011 RepID=UPI00404AEDBF